MRILHTSDWHLGKTLENISRLEEQKQFADELCSLAEKEDIDLVLVAGDIFDTYTPSSAAEELFYELVDRLNGKGKRAVVVIAGNHDSPERLCAASPLAYKNGIILLGYPSSDAGEYPVHSENIRVVDAGTGWLEIALAGCPHSAVVIALPYPSEARLEEVFTAGSDEYDLQQAYSGKVGSIFSRLSGKFRGDTVNLAVSHLFMLGGRESESERTIQVGGAMTVDPSVLPAQAHYVALGHLHRPQKVGGTHCPAYYSGSPLAYSFSEAGYSKAVYLIDAVPGMPAEIREIPVSSGRPLRRWTAKNGIEEAISWCEEGKDSGAWIDLEVHTDRILTVEEQKRLRELNPGILNIRPVIRTDIQEESVFENRESRKLDELFKEFYRHRVGLEASEELLSVFLDVLNREEEKADGGEGIASQVS